MFANWFSFRDLTILAHALILFLGTFDAKGQNMRTISENENGVERVGLYIKSNTRDQLNLYKAKRSAETGRPMSQSEAIDELLDIARRWEQMKQLQRA